MENQLQKNGTSLQLPVIPVKHRRYENSSLEECRNLVRVLAGKTEILYREYRSDKNIAMHIRTMGLTLETLTSLVNKLDTDARSCCVQEILEDARGFTYQSVRSCDLDRLSDK